MFMIFGILLSLIITKGNYYGNTTSALCVISPINYQTPIICNSVIPGKKNP